MFITLDATLNPTIDEENFVDEYDQPSPFVENTIDDDQVQQHKVNQVKLSNVMI